MSINKVKTAVIGCGAISDIYLQNLTEHFSIIDLKACANRTMSKAEASAQKYGLRAMTVEEILNDPEIEMVIDLTDPPSHFSVNSACLKAGKHVYTEKVLSPKLEDAAELVRLADEKHLYLGAAPDTFLGSSIQTARAAIDAGMIGDVTSCVIHDTRDYRFFIEQLPFLAREGGGMGFDLGIYYMTALIYVLGPVKRVAGMMKKLPGRKGIHLWPRSENFMQSYSVDSETILTGCMEFTSGVYGTFQMNSDSIFPEQPIFQICGTEGVLSMSDPNLFGGDVYLRAKGSETPLLLPNHHGFSENSRGLGAAEMAWAIRKGRPNRASKEMAYHGLEVLSGMALSSTTGSYYDLKSTFDRPAPLPMGYPDCGYMECDPEAALAL